MEATVRLHASWGSDREIFSIWSRYLKDDGCPTSLKLIHEGEPDWWIVFNHPRDGFLPDPKRTLLYQFEPSWLRCDWPPPWNDPPEDLVAGCHTIDRYQMPFHWSETFDKSWQDLAGHPPVKSELLSAVISGKAHSEMAMNRRNFLIRHAGDIPALHHYGCGWEDAPTAAYRGSLGDKSAALLPYRYTLAVENCRERNYFTEKITDAIVSETLAFYCGCSNLEEFIDPECYIRIDIADHEGTLRTIAKAIADGEWEKRLPALRREKRRILHEKLFFADLKRHLSLIQIQ